MNITQVIAVVGIPSVAAVAAVWKVATELRVKRHVEITDRFLTLLRIAHARPGDGRDSVGISEQIGAIELVAAFGRRDRMFTDAASSALTSITDWAGSDAGTAAVRTAAGIAKARLPKRRW